MDPEVTSLLDQIENCRNEFALGYLDEAAAMKKLHAAAHGLCRALEGPADIFERVCYQVCESTVLLPNYAFWQVEDGLILRSNGPQSLDELAAATGADGVLLVHLLTWDFNRSFDVLSPVWNKLPAYLATHNYQNPTHAMDVAFHAAHNTNYNFIQFLATKPDLNRSLQTYLSGFNEGLINWMDFYPVEKKLVAGARQDPDAIMFVDIGGGMGYETVALKKRFPHLPGRCVVQDLPNNIQGQELAAGVETMAHDYFTPQPLKGARVYYLRYILQNWDSVHCGQILRHIRNAMNPSYSTILINQWVMPTQHATSFAAHEDLNMMATFGATQRTEQQMRVMLERAGLRLAHIWRPAADLQSECIVEAVVDST
ncbi:MAG: hypothetical protein Q9191_004631, partial [Dirinaria sp. TL-2023a]